MPTRQGSHIGCEVGVGGSGACPIPKPRAVSLRRADGRRALLAFTGLEPLHRWNRSARPLPLTTGEAARTALRDGASALVVNVAGPVTLVLEGPDLTAVASGWTLARVADDRVWIAPAPE